MKIYAVLVIFLLFFSISCTHQSPKLLLNYAESLDPSEVQIDGYLAEVYSHSMSDSAQKNHLIGKTDSLGFVLQQLIILANHYRETGLDSLKQELDHKWELIRKHHLTPYGLIKEQQTIADYWNGTSADYNNTRLWLQLNILLFKMTGSINYCEAIEEVVYNTDWGRLISKEELKAVFYTHNFDDIYVNILGMSEMNYTHTTGGNIRIIQDTDYPYHDHISFRFECGDKRLVNLYVKIPQWAENAVVYHGNVKYVAYPGEYCLVSRKWKTGDVLQVNLPAVPHAKRFEMDGKKGLAFTLGHLFFVPQIPGKDGNQQTVSFTGSDPDRFLRLVSAEGQTPVFLFEGIGNQPVIYRDLLSLWREEFDYHGDMVLWEGQL